uniref:Family with sequence similarity 170 member B n=1 Tax=Chrysemys picta bellii TaxID=8478 RepID=A0A8C3P5L4_CHRPI
LSESQRSGESPPCQGVSAGSPVPGETAEERVSASAGPRDPSQQTSTATSVTSHSSARGVQPATLFYMQVRVVNGVSVAWETGTGFGAIRKRPRIFKAHYSGGESFAGSDRSSSHTRSELGDVDAELGDVDPEAESDAGGPAEEALQQPMGAPPEWLLTPEQGLRCLACCRVFPSLEALTQHVKQGLREGFSCRVYYRVLGQLRAGELPRKRRRRGARECSKCGGEIRRPRKAAR